MGLQETETQSLLERLKTYLGDRRLLVVLDNFEQVVDAGPAVAELLAACPGLKVIVTSRAGLHLSAEREFPLSPLALPDPQNLDDLAALRQAPAVALFLRRAQAVKPDFQLTPANAPAIVDICSRLDGLPLAIELAAAPIELLPPQGILARLERRLQFLIGGPQDLPARQQTLESAIAWSYALLEPDEQRLFRRLAIFAGGGALSAAEAVGNLPGEPPMDVLEGVASLIDKNLLARQAEQADGEPLLTMLATIREYGLAQLDGSGEIEAVRRAHYQYYLRLAQTAEPKLVTAWSSARAP